MRLVESLAKVLCPGAEGGVDIAPFLEGFETAEEPAAALAGHEGHVYLARNGVEHLAFDGDLSDLQTRDYLAYTGGDGMGCYGGCSGYRGVGLAAVRFDVGDGEAQQLDAGTGLAYEVVVAGLKLVSDGFGEVVFELRLVCGVDVVPLDFGDEEDFNGLEDEGVGPFQDVGIFEVDQPVRVSGIGLEL